MKTKSYKVSLVRNPIGALTAKPDYTITSMTNLLSLRVPVDTDTDNLRIVYVGDRISEEQAKDILNRELVDVTVTPAK